MTLSKTNKTVYIDKEATSALDLLKEGLLYPVTKLMNQEESLEVLKTGLINKQTFPFPFILAPAGKRNEEIIASLKVGEEITLVCEGQVYATMCIEDLFAIDPSERTRQIYGTDDPSHPGVMSTIKRIGNWAISGDFTRIDPKEDQYKKNILEAKKSLNAGQVKSLVMAANPLHRAHEKLIRQALDTTDILVIFLLKPYDNTNLSYDIRKETLDYFISNYLPTSRVIVVPLENSYIFAGYNEIIIDAIVAKNYGCDILTVGRNHAGLGMFYDCNSNKSIVDRVIGIDIKIEIASEFVYCDKCTTLVSTNSCPHGQHHQISYHSDSILELLEVGLLPPAVLIRKDISAFILSRILPNRFKNIEKLYYDLLPVGGLLEEHSEHEFYLELMKLYQTTSLT